MLMHSGGSVNTTYIGWALKIIDKVGDLWFSDGRDVSAVHGGSGLSSRLIVGGQGFLDITNLISPNTITIDFNGLNVYGSATEHVLIVQLSLRPGGKFTARLGKYAAVGSLKPLLIIIEDDIAFINNKINDKYVPFQNIPNAPGKTNAEIRKLGKQFFPFTPYSYELALCMYDWTTASFIYMVLFKVFEYASMQPLLTFPINKFEIANMIWQSNWRTYNPRNKDYMNSFLMKPVNSLANVKNQLESVSKELHKLSDIENRLLSAAISALPRTSVSSKGRLFSGQMDIYQFGLDYFGPEFLECPLNSGPVKDSMTININEVLSTYVSTGQTVTTKMFWAFTDTAQDAIHYANSILLIANPPDARNGSWVWEQATYVTPISDNYNKTEYIFPPRSKFKVLSVEKTTVEGKNFIVINLQPLAQNRTQDQLLEDQALDAIKLVNLPQGPLSLQEFEEQAALYSPTLEEQAVSKIKDGKAVVLSDVEEVIPHETGGRWCRCVVAIETYSNSVGLSRSSGWY